MAPSQVGRRDSEPRAGRTRGQTREATGSAHIHDEKVTASKGEKRREEAGTALAKMVDDKFSVVEVITAAAGQVVRQDAIVSIQNELADNEFLLFRS